MSRRVIRSDRIDNIKIQIYIQYIYILEWVINEKN